MINLKAAFCLCFDKLDMTESCQSELFEPGIPLEPAFDKPRLTVFFPLNNLLKTDYRKEI